MLRLSELARICGTTTDSLRNRTRDGLLPWWEDRREEGKHRRFDGEHALLLVIADVLIAQGIGQGFAAEVVRANHKVVARFLDEIAAGLPAEERFIAAAKVCEESEGERPLWLPHVIPWSGSADEIVGFLAKALANTGRTWMERGRIVRRVAGPTLAIAPVRECYLRLKAQAAAEGFRLEGRVIGREGA